MFSYEYCEIFKNTYFEEPLRMAPSEPYTGCHKLYFKSNFIINMMDCAFIQSPVYWKTLFSKRLNNHRKDITIQNLFLPIFISENLGIHSTCTQNLHQWNNCTTTKRHYKIRLKRREDLWIKKFETMTRKVLNQKLNDVQILINCIYCLLFSIFDWS